LDLKHPMMYSLGNKKLHLLVEFRKLKKLNGFQFELIEKAVANENGKQILYYPFHKSSSKLAMTGSLVNVFLGTDSKFKDIPYKTVNVDTITLEDACASTRNATLIKLDCEGNELPILRSSPSILNREDVDFIIEVLVGDKNKHEIFKLMKEYNYRGFLITHGGLIDEDRPLTLSNPNNKSRTLWRNHFFTKKSKSEVQQFSNKCYGISSLH